MYCPKCNSNDTRVIDSRIGKNGLTIRRRRQCQQCDYRFSTLEEIVREGLIVIKRDNTRDQFDRAKMLTGIRKACEKRSVDIEQLDMLISDVLVELETFFDSEIPSRAIGDCIMKHLKRIDKIAYVRYASVYKDFRDIDEMIEELSKLQERNG